MMDILPTVRRICLALPEVTERLSHGTPTWFVQDKKTFATLWPDGHHQVTYPQLWCAAPAAAATELIAGNPEMFFSPPYVGHRGWVGLRLDGDTDIDELAEVIEDAYRTVAAKPLIAILDAAAGRS
jgi:hypothetical protein